MNAPQEWVRATRAALVPLADPERAAPMVAYMKGVAPFLGVSTPERRAALRTAWRALPELGPDEVADVATHLWDLPEREYQYAACDLLAKRQRWLPSPFLAEPVQALLTTKPWWDTVDSLGTAVVTPLVARDPALVELMWTWWNTGDRWLVRAAIQHQRGLKDRTDLARLLAMCDRYSAEREFFVAKAIGWALRDAARWDPAAVRRFVDAHPDLSAVARREAQRGLERNGRSGAVG